MAAPGKRKRRLYRALALAASAALAAALETRWVPAIGADGGERVLFYVLLNLNLAALAALVWVVGRSVYGIYREWRSRVIGYRFKTRLMLSFLIVTAIPLAALFLVSSGLGTNYIERFFRPQIKGAMESAVGLAGAYYDQERALVRTYAEAFRSGVPLPAGYTSKRYRKPPEDATPAVLAAFAGRAETEVISSVGGDIIRAVLPARPYDPRRGVIAVETRVPPEIADQVAHVLAANENYLSLEGWKSPLRMNYMLLLGFFTTIIVLSALWFAIRIGRWITDPVKSLAAATEAVAAGNLDVSIKFRRQDEMGMLVESFNRMVREMRADKESLTRAYLNLESIVKNIQSGVISLDERGLVREINDAACYILGISRDKSLGRYYMDILENVRSDELFTMIKGINLHSFSHVEREVRIGVGSPEVRKYLRVSISGLRDQGGIHLGLLVVVDDLSHVIKAQRALAWQEVARRMAHEIKNPLTPIQLATERMVRKWERKDVDFGGVFERSTSTIITEVDGLKRLCNEFARMGKMPEVRKVSADIMEIVSGAVDLYRGYPDLHIEVETLPGEALPHIHLDPEQIKRVLINLIDNARDAMENRGTIIVRVGLDREENRMRVEVADEGPGIRPEDMEKLFQPYFSTKKEGTGLGLAIADKIVSDHGGSISVRPGSPRGSVLSVELPVEEV